MSRLPDRRSRARTIALGIIASNIFGFLVILLIYLANMERESLRVFTLTFFFLDPVLMGAIVALAVRRENISYGMLSLLTLLNTCVALALSAILLKEGAFCLMIVSPIILVSMYLGAVLATWLLRRRDRTLNVSAAFLVVMVLFFDLLAPHEHHAEVADTMLIHAPPARVWEHVVAFPAIEAEPRYWFFRIGLPKPIATTVDGYRQGAGRKCIFDNGVVFDEVMSVFEPGRELTFDIVGQPADPEILGHLTLDKGRFLLRDNGDGTTTLTGTSWYRLHIFPAWYFDLWAGSIVRNVHLRVMEHIRDLAEAEPAGRP